MLFSKSCKYAIRGLAEMAQHPQDQIYTIQELATQLEVPAPSLSKTFQVLVKEGFLCSIPGRYGGYSFDRSPEEISLYDIMMLLDRQESSHEVPASDTPFHRFPQWKALQNEIEIFLRETTLNDLTQPLN